MKLKKKEILKYNEFNPFIYRLKNTKCLKKRILKSKKSQKKI